MSTWLYQLNQTIWNPQRYRIEIWEGQTWFWQVGKMKTQDHTPTTGDIVIFYYAKTSCDDPGFYGWAVILEWVEENSHIMFRPASPSDHLKMDPWWDDDARQLADDIRGSMKQGTLWYVDDEKTKRLRTGITSWLAVRTKR